MSSKPPSEKEQAYKNRLLDTGTGKMALFVGITFGMLVVLDKILPGTGLLMAVAILLLYMFRTNAIEWVNQFFKWLTGLV
jgi:hypothetical protein